MDLFSVDVFSVDVISVDLFTYNQEIIYGLLNGMIVDDLE